MDRHIQTVLVILIAADAGLSLCVGCGTQVGIAASPADVYVEVGDTADITVVAVMDIGAARTVSSPLTLGSSDETIAAVSDEAVIGVAEGEAVVAISDGTFSTTAVVHVVAVGTLPDNLVVTPTSVVCDTESGDTQLKVFAIFATGATEDVTDQATYESSDTDVALVTVDGAVVCISNGGAEITTRYFNASEVIDVAVEEPPPESIAFGSSTLECTAGESHAVQVLAYWEDGSTTDVSLSAAYRSTDMSVATVYFGQVYCRSEGTANIIASVSGVTSVLSVGVDTAASSEAVGLYISPSSIACSVSETAEFSVIAEFGDGSLVDVTADNRTQYQSSDPTVAPVVLGQVWCVQQGQAIVQASYGDLTAAATVTVP